LNAIVAPPPLVRMQPLPAFAVAFRLALPLVLALATPPVAADAVRLGNGDRLTGTVVVKTDATLVLRTRYAGDVRIAWGEIVEIVVDQPVDVMLTGQAPSPATLTAAAPGQVGLVRDGALPEPVDLAQIAYINPQPDQSGTGIAWRGHANVAATLSRGNATNERLYGEAQLEARAKDYRWNAGAKVNRVRDGHATAVNSWLADASLDRFIRARHFLYARSSLEHDPSRDLELRAAAGAGYGWQAIETSEQKLSLRGGLDYVRVDRDAGADESYPALGWALRYEQWLADRRLQLFQEQEGFWNARDLAHVVLRTRTGVRVPVFASIEATAQLNVDWDSEPASGRDPVDSVWLLGLGYKW
jgi:putative salt-induced outer membrane protein YdiY